MTLSDADVGNHVLYVAANDGTGLSTPLQVTIAITDVNHLPDGCFDRQHVDCGRRRTAGAWLHSMATDQDNDTLTYVITDAQGVAVTGPAV